MVGHWFTEDGVAVVIIEDEKISVAGVGGDGEGAGEISVHDVAVVICQAKTSEEGIGLWFLGGEHIVVWLVIKLLRG